MARAVAVAMTVFGLLVLAGCGGSDGGATEGREPTNSVAETCASYSGRAAAACEHSYYACATKAEAEVRRYHDEGAPRLDLVAEEATNGAYREPVLRGAFAGCLASLTDAYNRLYAG